MFFYIEKSTHFSATLTEISVLIPPLMYIRWTHLAYIAYM
jgi:hypothetical protein